MSHENQGRHRAYKVEDTPNRGVDFGPYDISEVSPEVLDELRQHIAGQMTVRTRSLWLRVPEGSSVSEIHVDGQDNACGLFIQIKGTTRMEPMDVSLTVYAAAVSDRLWETQGKQSMLETMEADDLAPRVRQGMWGDEILSRVPVSGGQQFIVIGADGPRWMVRAVAYGRHMVEGNWEVVADIVDSCVVNRGSAPEPPGVELDVSLLPHAS